MKIRIFLSCVLLAGLLVAEEKAQKSIADEKKQAVSEEEAQEQELKVTADTMEMLIEKHQLQLEGNVLVEDETMRLTAKKMIIFLDKDNKMRNIEAIGGVTVRKLDASESATGDSGFYDAQQEQVTLKGNCVILQGKNTIRGNTVVYNKKDNTIRLKDGFITIPVKKGAGTTIFK